MSSILLPFVFSLGILVPAQVASTHAPAGMAGQPENQFEHLAQAASLERQKGEDVAAIDLYQKALQLKPDWPEGLWYQSTLLYENERFPEASLYLRRFLALAPENGYAWALLGMAEFQTRDYDRALNHLQQSLVLGLGDNGKMVKVATFTTAILLTRSEHFDESLNLLFSRVASGDPIDSLVEPLGLAALRIPVLPAEIPAGRRQMVHLAGAAVLALEAQHFREAEARFTELKDSYSSEPGVHFLVGAYLLGVHPDDGIDELKRELEISPSHVTARLRLAAEFLKRQDTKQGISYAQQALQLEPNNGLAHRLLGEGMLASGDPKSGITEMETARAAMPDSLQIHWDLFRAYTSTGRLEDATREKSEIERINKLDAPHQ